MKTKYIKGIIIGSFTATMLLFSSCLKDSRFFDPESVTSNLAELPLSGLQFFPQDAITQAGVDTITFAVGVTAANPPTTPTTVVIAVDNTLIASYNAANPSITYLPVPAASYKLPATSITIPAGVNFITTTVIVDRTALDPAGSYMLPIKIVSAGGLPISANYGIHYYHIIGNDFAGSYIWEYRRYQNGTGPGAGKIPSLGQGTPPDITNAAGSTTTLSPVSPTEFVMQTGYNGQGVQYDVTFTRTVSGSTITYTNWKVTFPAAEIAKWTNAGIINVVPPSFTIPPPANNSSPKIFELNYISMGAAAGSSPRYIDDTYHH
jgi:hypothetical protein